MAYFYLTGAALVWGGAFVVGRFLVAGADPLVVAWARFVLASAAFAAIELATGVTARRRAARTRTSGAGDPAAPGGSKPGWTAYALLGLTGIFAYNLLFFYGLRLTTAAESSLIIAASPVVVAVIGVVFLAEPLSPRKALGILVSVGGVALVILGAVPSGPAVASGGGVGPRVTGDLLMVGCVLSWAAYSALGKRVLRHVGALAATARAVWWGTLFLTVAVVFRLGARLPAALAVLGHPGPLLGIGYLSLVCTVFGFVAWYRGLAATDVSGASVFLNLVPLSTLVIASLALGERPSLVQLAGGLLVLGGVTVVSALGSGRARRSASSPS